ncbi:hypothetical protein [Streptococcus fryi]
MRHTYLIYLFHCNTPLALLWIRIYYQSDKAKLSVANALNRR